MGKSIPLHVQTKPAIIFVRADDIEDGILPSLFPVDLYFLVYGFSERIGNFCIFARPHLFYHLEPVSSYKEWPFLGYDRILKR